MVQKGNKFKSGKRKKSTFKEVEWIKFINCIKTYRETLNDKILKQWSYYSDQIKNLPSNGKKQWVKKLVQSIKTSLSNSKFGLVPFFSVLEKNVKISLRLLAFVQMLTYILYCPIIAQCPWLQWMIPTNINNCNFLMHKIHSPIIIHVEKSGTFCKEVYDKEMDNFFTREMNNYFSSSDFASGHFQEGTKFIHLDTWNWAQWTVWKIWWIDELSFRLCIGQSEWRNVFVRL